MKIVSTLLVTLFAVARAEVEVTGKDLDDQLRLVPNANYVPHQPSIHVPYSKHGYVYGGNYDLEGLITRQEKFMTPPQAVLDELRSDNITDKWEVDCLAAPNANCTFDKKPIIGILTQPVGTDKKDTFNYNDYILEINDNFVRWAGSKTVAIPYDISEDNLTEMLRQVNGVLFTGGGLHMINETTGEQHPYYKTAKQVMQYSKYMKDVKNQTWPVLGICQGLEVVSLIQSGDDMSVLDEIFMYGENRNVSWASNASHSQLWGTFPEYLREAMEDHKLSLHAHSFSVSVPTFHRTSLDETMTITQTDNYTLANMSRSSFVDSMEAKNYPIYVTMYHPEYQLLDFTGPKMWSLASHTENKKFTDEIAFRLSLKLNRDARTNTNKVSEGQTQTFMEIHGVSRVPAQDYPMVPGLNVMAYGYQAQQSGSNIE